MCAYFVMALAIPRAPREDGLAFGLAFGVVTLIHTLLFLRVPQASWRLVSGFAPFNFAGAGLAIAAGLVDPRVRWILWLGAVAAFIAVTLRRGERRVSIGAAHFAERHGLVILIAIGESVVALGASINQTAIRWHLVKVVTLGFALCAALWWTYFDGDDIRGEHALGAADEERRARLGMLAYGYPHLGMIAGIVGVAVGLHDAMAAVGQPVSVGHAWMLAGGITLYLACNKLFRVMLAIGSSRWRSAAAVAALGAAPLGWRVSAPSEVAALVAILVAMLVLERWPRGRANRRVLA
jgi:low temperature requirement protein LtrA